MDKAECHTFLENIRIRTNGERRVQRTARAFTEALFGVDMHQQSPILHSPDLLDNIPDEARELLDQTKQRMKKIMVMNFDFSISDSNEKSPSSSPSTIGGSMSSSYTSSSSSSSSDAMSSLIAAASTHIHVPTSSEKRSGNVKSKAKEEGKGKAKKDDELGDKGSDAQDDDDETDTDIAYGTSDSQLIEDIKLCKPWGLDRLGNPLARLVRLDRGIKSLRKDLARKVDQLDPTQYYAPMCEHESFRTMQHRWDKVSIDLHDPESNTWDVTKIGDIYDSIRFDVIHMSDILRKLSVPMEDLLSNSKALADFWVTQEYGISHADKLEIGRLIAGPLLNEIISNIENAAFNSAPSVNLYFTSESHLHGLLNLIMLSGVEGMLLDRENVTDLDYLTHLLFKVYESEQSKTFRVELFLSAGAIACNPKMDVGQTHALPIESPLLVHENLSLFRLRSLLNNSNTHQM